MRWHRVAARAAPSPAGRAPAAPSLRPSSAPPLPSASPLRSCSYRPANELHERHRTAHASRYLLLSPSVFGLFFDFGAEALGGQLDFERVALFAALVVQWVRLLNLDHIRTGSQQ